MFYWSMAMTIVANLSYALCLKNTAPQANPLAALMITYSIALAASLALYPLLSEGHGLVHEFKQLNVWSYLLGVVIVGLEVGFIYVFRAGWPVTYATMFSNVAVAALLIPIGYVFFHDRLSTVNYLGVALAVTGLVLMAKRSP